MRCGIVRCSCGQTAYVETMQPVVLCLKCKKPHDVSGFPEKGEIEEPVEDNG